MSKIKLAILILIPLVAVTLFGLAYTVLHTQPGANWLLGSLQGRLAGSLEVGGIEGDLGSGLTVKALSYRDEALAVRAERIQLVVDLDLFPPLVQVDEVKIMTLDVEQLKSSSEATSLDEILAALDLPAAIEVSDLLAEKLSVTGPDGDLVFAADRLGATVGLDDNLRIDRLFVESEQQVITLEGQLGLASPYPLNTIADIQIQWVGEDDTPQAHLIEARIDGNFRHELKLDVTSDTPSIRLSGTLSDPTTSPQWQLKIESSEVPWPPGQADRADFSITNLSATTRGWVDAYQLSAEGRIIAPDIDAHQFSLNGEGHTGGMKLSSLSVSGEGLELSATGTLSFLETFELDLLTTIHQVQPATWLEEWPETSTLNGQVSVTLAESGLEFSELQLEAAGTPFKLSGNGQADFSQGTLAADLNWRDFSWPLGAERNAFGSSQGAIRIEGVLDDWTARLDAGLEAPGLPGGNLQVEASGNRERATVTIVEGRVLGGVVSGDAELNWQDQGRWAANLSSSGLELARVFPQWPARINTVLSAHGQAEPLEVHVDIHQLDGEYKTIPLTAQGGIDYRDDLPSFDGFSLGLGRSAIEVNGQIRSTAGLSFSLRVNDLASLNKRGQGTLDAAGRLSLHPQTPHLSLNLEGSELVWDDFQAKSISIHDSADGPQRTIANLEIEATEVLLLQQPLNAVKMNLYAGLQDQVVQLEVHGSDVSLEAGMGGAFLEGGENFLSSGWAGQLTSMAITAQDRLTLALQSPAVLEWSPSSAKLGRTCLEASPEASLCVRSEWIEGQLLSALFQLNRVPLSLMRPFLETDLEFTQTIDGEFNWASTAGKPASGSAAFQLSPGELRYPDDFDSLLRTGEGLLSFNLDQGRLSEGKILLPLPDLGVVDFDLAIPNVTSGLDATVRGHLNVTVADMDVITLFFPVIDQAGGRFAADLDLTGSIAEPDFSGQLSLENGLVRHHASGLRLNDINLAGRVLNNDQTTLDGSFKALEGSGELNGRLDLTDIIAPRLELGLTGENLKLFDAPDLTLIAEPDLRLAWQPGLIEIDGSILIPSAKIAPDFIPATTVSESPDLVIVAGEPPDTETPEDEEITVSIRGNLDVTLGDDVRLDLDHARARLSGSVNFAWQDALLPIANGQYSLVGQINALGQRLEITQGTIGFPGVPADNPHLNIRAEREIYGNSEIRRAGVFVTGTLRRFAMEPYTEPMTNRERARTLLITGSDFNMEEGVGAVDIGFYVAPRIFLSYGIGVFDDDNVVSVRYDLGRGWGVKATSGQRQTGLDLSYTIER